MTVPFPFQNSYARLPAEFFAPAAAHRAPAPRLLAFNRPLSLRLGLDVDTLERDAARLLSGAALPEGAEPIALGYAGHQFGQFNPSLGDGRALLLGEVVAPDGARFDIQLKGSGPTRWSRGGDGRAALGPVLREYLVSEAMAALGVATTRSLAAVATGDTVLRETELPGAVLTRVAASHIRVGTFQYFAARGDRAALERLLAYAVRRHAPEAGDAPRPALGFFEHVIAAQARLVAHWMSIGFVHGVMNTDNMAVSGETIDYGPCAFMDRTDPLTVFSSIDRGGRYAFRNQPGIAMWNLARLGEALLPLLADTDEAGLAAANTALGRFADLYTDAYEARLRAKLGLFERQEDDAELIADWLALLEANLCDFTNTHRHLADAAEGSPEAVRAEFADPTAFDGFAARWQARLGAEAPAPDRAARMRAANPAIIPRNHLVEEALAAAHGGDMGPFHALHAALAEPFGEGAPARLREPAPESPVPYRTFCGT